MSESGGKGSQIPPGSKPATVNNLLSSVAPPTSLPNFIPTQQQDTIQPKKSTSTIPERPEPNSASAISEALERLEADNHVNLPFNPAIPLIKGEPMEATRSPESSHATSILTPTSIDSPIQESLGDPMPGSGLLTWMKGAVSSGGLLHRVAEKAKHSVDSMITTLDPQMKEYLNSGGDVQILVASDKDDKVSPIREAFQNVFGKATVIGLAAQWEGGAVQPVGAAAAVAGARARIALLRSQHNNITNNTPVLAVENYIAEVVNDKWFDIGCLVLTHPSLNIELHVFTQATTLPSAVVAALRAETPADYQHKETGFSNTIGSWMAANLQVHHSEWHEALTGVSRRDMILLAARSIAGSYKKLLAVSTNNIS